MANGVISSDQSPDAVSSWHTPRWAWVSGILALGIFVSLTLAVSDQPFDWDLVVSHTIQSVRDPALDVVMHGISMADNNVLGPALLVSAACIVLAALRAWREAAVLIGLVLVGQGLWVACGRIVDRPRPDSALIQVLIEEDAVHGFSSFPSGHTVYYTAFFGFLWFLTLTMVKSPLLRWPLLVAFGGIVLLVGVARVYLGAHWPSDIVGGYLLGWSVLMAGIVVYRRWSS